MTFESVKAKLPRRDIAAKVVGVCLVACLIFTTGFSLINKNTRGNHAIRGAAIMTCRSITTCLLQYMADHQGHFPEGKTSTEVFQHLIDERYVTNPAIFYFEYAHIPGKTLPLTDTLKSENVCWDVTCCVDSSSPGSLPVVFLTGYKITYKAGSSALPLVPPLPSHDTLSGWWYGTNDMRQSFIAVCYKDNSTLSRNAGADGSIPNFIPATFDPAGKTYRQLTP